MKESKQVFYLHHLTVRSEPAISLQEALVLFASNFIRWASRLFASPGATGRKRSEHAQAGRQTPSTRGRARLGASHRVFRRSEAVCKVVECRRRKRGKIEEVEQ
jgi:hypothetical protein